MKFTISSTMLTAKMKMVNSVINSQNVLPILADIVFTITGKVLSLKASDGENTLMTDVELVEAEGEGAFAVGAKDIIRALENIPERPVTIEVNDDKTLSINYESGQMTIPYDDTTEYPVLPEVGTENVRQMTVSEKMLAENIMRTLFATAQDELRPVMNGIYFDLTTEHLAVVASDGHKLALSRNFTVKAASEEQGGAFILPKKPAAILKKLLGKDADKLVNITFSDRMAEIVAPEFTIRLRLIEGRYPNFNAVIPKSNDKTATVERENLTAALRRVAPFSSESTNLIRVEMKDNYLTIEAEDYDFSRNAKEQIPCQQEGDTIVIGLKGVSVAEILDAIGGKEVTLAFSDPARAALILPAVQPEETEITMLVMPMLLA